MARLDSRSLGAGTRILQEAFRHAPRRFCRTGSRVRKERKSERARERESERARERESESESESDTHTQTDRHRQTDRQTNVAKA